MNTHSIFKFNHVLECWDQRKDAIFNQSRKLAKLDDEEFSIIAEQLANNITMLTENYSIKDFVKFGYVMAEDLYKASNRHIQVLDKALYQYIESTAGKFSEILHEKDLIVHFLIVNTFRQNFPGMHGPLELYRDWFKYAGFFYICPQHIALDIIKMKKLNPSDYFELLPRTIEAARKLSKELIEMCHKEKRHYVFLDTDPVKDSFELPLSFEEKPGVITIVRTEAPVEGSNSLISCQDKNGKSLVSEIEYPPLPKEININEQISRYFSDDSIKTSDKPKFALLIGGVASGKTTMRKQRFNTGYVVIDAGDIINNLMEKGLNEWKDIKPLLDTIGRQVTQRAINENRNLVTEMTSDPKNNVEELIDSMDGCGYKTELVSVECNPEIAKERDKNRSDDNFSSVGTQKYHCDWLRSAIKDKTP